MKPTMRRKAIGQRDRGITAKQHRTRPVLRSKIGGAPSLGPSNRAAWPIGVQLRWLTLLPSTTRDRLAIVSVQSAAVQPRVWLAIEKKSRGQAGRKTSGGSTAKPSRSASAGRGSIARTIAIGPQPAQSQAINRCGCSLGCAFACASYQRLRQVEPHHLTYSTRCGTQGARTAPLGVVRVGNDPFAVSALAKISYLNKKTRKA